MRAISAWSVIWLAPPVKTMGLPVFKGSELGADPAPLDQRRGGQIKAVQE